MQDTARFSCTVKLAHCTGDNFHSTTVNFTHEVRLGFKSSTTLHYGHYNQIRSVNCLINVIIYIFGGQLSFNLKRHFFGLANLHYANSTKIVSSEFDFRNDTYYEIFKPRNIRYSSAHLQTGFKRPMFFVVCIASS